VRVAGSLAAIAVTGLPAAGTFAGEEYDQDGLPLTRGEGTAAPVCGTAQALLQVLVCCP
jgi:hypothetical protein